MRSIVIKPDILREFQRIDRATLSSGQRLLPTFKGDNQIDLKWYVNNDIER
jgi:hypothetical protein